MKFFIFMLFSVISLSLFSPIMSDGQSYSDDNMVSWVKVSNPSNGWDIAYAVCEKREYLYVVGIEQHLNQYKIRVEKRLKSNGEIVNVWVHNFSVSDTIYDCLIVGDFLYLVGSSYMDKDRAWIILAVDLDFKNVKHVLSNPSENPDIALAVSSYQDHLYVGGVEMLGGDCRWRVEKRSLKDLSLAQEYISNPTNSCDVIFDVKINPATGDVWVIGYEALRCRKCDGRLEILDSNFKLLRILKPFTGCFKQSLTFNHEGSAFISGVNILKYSKDGENIFISSIPARYGVTWINGKLYSFDIDLKDGEWRPSIYLFDENLHLQHHWVINLRLNSSLYATSCFATAFPVFGEISNDNEHIYIAGTVGDPSTGDTSWIIYSINVSIEKHDILKIALFSISIILSLSLAILTLKYIRLRKFQKHSERRLEYFQRPLRAAGTAYS